MGETCRLKHPKLNQRPAKVHRLWKIGLRRTPTVRMPLASRTAKPPFVEAAMTIFR